MLRQKGRIVRLFCPTRIFSLGHVSGIEYAPCVCRRTSYTSFLSVNGSDFEAKLSVKALAITWVAVIAYFFLFEDNYQNN